VARNDPAASTQPLATETPRLWWQPEARSLAEGVVVRDRWPAFGARWAVSPASTLLLRARSERGFRGDRGGAGDEVTSLTLREVRVQSALQLGGLYVSAVADSSGETVSGAEFVRQMRERNSRTSMESAADAATTYRLTTAVNPRRCRPSSA
jgi:hypothetical protein